MAHGDLCIFVVIVAIATSVPEHPLHCENYAIQRFSLGVVLQGRPRARTPQGAGGGAPVVFFFSTPTTQPRS